MAKPTFGDKVREFRSDVQYLGGLVAEGAKALVTGDKRRLLLLLSLGFSSCDKPIDDFCDYGKGTFEIHQTISSVDRTPQGLIKLPFVLSAEDIECGTALVKVDIDVYDVLTGEFLGTYSQQVNDYDGINKVIYFTLNLPSNCNGVKGTAVLATDENSQFNKEDFRSKSSAPFKFDIH